MSDDNIRTFEVDNEEFAKLVEKKLGQIAEILADPQFEDDMKALEKDPDSMGEARMNRIMLDMYAAQSALFASIPRNIMLLMSAELISEEDGKKLFVVAKMLEMKADAALNSRMETLEEEAEKQAKKPDLRVVH